MNPKSSSTVQLTVADRRFEHSLLTAYALRFDGYRYLEEENVEQKLREARECLLTKGEPELSLLEKMALFFLQQRFLCKWGGEQLPLFTHDWRVFRELFLEVAPHDVPPAYRDPSRYNSWHKTHGHTLDDDLMLVRKIHASTSYRKWPTKADIAENRKNRIHP